MKCPYCSHSFPLTWRRYWTSFTGKHKCPNCGQRSQLEFTLPYVAFFLAVALVTLVLARVLSIVLFDDWRSAPGFRFRIGFYAVAFVTFTILDRLFDARLRRLVKYR